MNLIPYQECQKTLDFQPEKSWPKSWPAFAWEKTIIAGWTHINTAVLNFLGERVNFLHLFYTCHPRLSLSELGRIITQFSKEEKKPVFSWKEFFPLYGFPQDPDFLIHLLKIFISTPPIFQNWSNSRSVHLNELRVLNSLKNTQQIHFLLEWIAQSGLSHSLGLRALELAVELLLMGWPADEILSQNVRNLPPEFALQTMEQKRKPLSFAQDQMKKENLKKISWPAQVTAGWQRKGDKTGVEIKIWCQNQKELKEKTEKISLLPIFDTNTKPRA